MDGLWKVYGYVVDGLWIGCQQAVDRCNRLSASHSQQTINTPPTARILLITSFIIYKTQQVSVNPSYL